MRWARMLALTVLAGLPSGAYAVTDGGIAVIDRPSGLGALPFDGLSDSGLGARSMSADGCFVVFESENDALFAGDENDAGNIFRKDRCDPGQPIEQVNTSAAGAPSDPERFAEDPSISANGRFVAFVSDAPSLGPAANGSSQVWVKDMQTGSVELASRADGASGQLSTDPFEPVISGDGNRVIFPSDGILDAANTDGLSGQTNAYVRDLGTDKTYLVSVKDSDGTAGGGVGAGLDISFDGSAVSFVSSSQLTAGDGDGSNDAYLARSVGPTPSQTLVSGALSASDATISSDGLSVAWTDADPYVTTCNPACGAANNLDVGVAPQVIAGQTVRQISFGYSGTTTAPAAPSDVFWMTDAALTAGDINTRSDLYSHLLSDLTVTGLQRITSGTNTTGISDAMADDGGALALFRSSSPDLPGSNGAHNQIYVQNGSGATVVSQVEPLHLHEAGNGTLNDLHTLGPSAAFAVFSSDAPGLGIPLSPTGGYREQVFKRTALTGQTTPVSVNDAGEFANGLSYSASVDAAGDRVAFHSLATNLAPGVAPSYLHVYVRDLTAGTTKLLDRTTGGDPSAGGAAGPEISADGSIVVFTSSSPDLPGAAPSRSHVYAANLATGALTLVDAKADGTPADDSSISADVSGDGSRVAFVSQAGNLGGADAGHRSAYVKDLGTGAVTWAGRPEDGNGAHTSAGTSIAISENGKRVAFVESDALFGFGSNTVPHVFLRDLDAGTTEIVSLGVPLGLNGAQSNPSLNADGKRLTFMDGAYPGHPDRTYFRDLSTGVTIPLENGRHGSHTANLDATGTCAAVVSSSGGLSDPGYPSPDYNHAYVRAIGGECLPEPPPPGGGGPGGGVAPDTTAPVISSVRVTNKRFRLGARRTAVTAKKKPAKRGTTFVFTLSEAARTTIAIAQRKPGRKKGKRCVKPRKGLKKRCTRYVAKVTLTRTKTAQGANRVKYSGRTAKGKLKPGRYRATLRATDAAGNRSKARTVTFTVVRR